MTNVVQPRAVKVKKKDRLEGLFLSLSQKFGYGKRYRGCVRGNQIDFEFQRVRKGGRRFRIAMRKQEHLTTVLVFTTPDHWWNRLYQWAHGKFSNRKKNFDVVAIVLTGGKTCPEQEHYHYHYTEAFRATVALPPSARFFNSIKINEILVKLDVAHNSEDINSYFERGFKSFEIVNGEIKFSAMHTGY